MHLDCGADQRDGFRLDTHELLVLQMLGHPALAPAVRRVWKVCHRANRSGSLPPELQPCLITYKMALRTCRLDMRMLPPMNQQTEERFAGMRFYSSMPRRYRTELPSV